VTHAETKVVRAVARLGNRKLTRAHVGLVARPAFRQEAQDALQASCAALEQQLRCPVMGTGRLLDAALDPRKHLPSTAVFALIHLSSTGSMALLEGELPFVVSLLARLSGLSGRLAAATQLTRIEDAALSFLVLVALSAIRHHEPLQRRFAPRLLSVHLWRREVLDQLDGGLHVGVEIGLDVGGTAGSLRLWVPAHVVQTVIADQGTSPGPIAPEVLTSALPSRVFAGRSTLDAADLAAIHQGDVVLLDGLRVSEGRVHGSARLLSPTFELAGTLAADGFSFSHARSRAIPQESSMATPPPPPIEHGASLPVEVEVELTRIKLPLADLAVIKSGALLPLHINASEPVLLRVGDRAIARAELVEIEGEVGARILTLLP
jgi:type III secretion protein Q